MLALSFEQKVLLALPPDLPDHTKVEKTYEAFEAYNRALKVYNDYYDALRWTKEDTSLVSKLCKSAGISSKNKQEDKEVEFVPSNRRERRKQEGISQTPIQRFLTVRKSALKTIESSPLISEEISSDASSSIDEKSFCSESEDPSKEEEAITMVSDEEQEKFEKSFPVDCLAISEDSDNECEDFIYGFPNLPEDSASRFVEILKLQSAFGMVACAARKKKGKKKKTKGKGGSPLYPPALPGSVTVRSLGRPPTYRGPFRFEHSGTLSGSISSNVAVRFNPNSLVNPVAGSTSFSFPDYTPFVSIYGEYLTLVWDEYTMFMNMNLFPVEVYVLNTNNDPSTNPGVAVQSQRLCDTRTLSMAGGMDRVIIRRRVRMMDLLGNRTVTYTNNALNNANPPDLGWMTVGARSIDGSFLTAGVYYKTVITAYGELSDPL